MKQQKNYYFWCHEGDNQVYDVYELFQYYDAHFFASQLQSCTLRWTKRMTLCAGTCKYQGFGSSTISLSEPLLKFRNSNQLKQTLLHEMIHAFLFKTNPAACQTDGGHGPAFKQIMTTINKTTGLNITVYHSFHNEVDFYKQHVWRCNGRCCDLPPYYGYVKRSMNRPPQPADFWFAEHRRVCGGQFKKISEPAKQSLKEKDVKKRQRKSKKFDGQKDLKKWGYGKSIADYIKQMKKEQNSNMSNSEQVLDCKQANAEISKQKTKRQGSRGKSKQIRQQLQAGQSKKGISVDGKEKGRNLNNLLEKYSRK